MASLWLGVAVGGVNRNHRVFPNVSDLSKGHHGNFSTFSSSLPLQKHMVLHPCV